MSTEIFQQFFTFTPLGFILSALVVGFLIGLFLAVFFWFRYVTRYYDIKNKNASMRKDVVGLESENKKLAARLKKSPEAGSLQSLPLVDTPAIDWSNINGIDPRVAAELKQLGIKNIDQLKKFSTSQRVALQKQLSAKGIDWQWGWLTQWKTGLPVAGRPAGSASAEKPTTVIPEVRFRTYNGHQFNWSAQPGMDPKLADEFNALGVLSPNQIDSLSLSERAKFEAHVKSKGLKWDWSWLSGWQKTAAATTAAGATTFGLMSGSGSSNAVDSVSSSIPGVTWKSFDGPRFDWTSQSDIEPGLARELHALGIKSPEQIDSLSLSERAKFQTHLKDKGLTWDWKRLTGWKAAATTAPASIAGINWKSHEGPEFNWASEADLDPKIAAEFDAIGIKSPDQIDSLSLSERVRFESHLKSRGIDWKWSWLSKWKTSTPNKPPVAAAPVFQVSPSSGTDQQKTSLPNLTLRSHSGPEFDWSSQKNIAPKLAAELKALGIKSPDQLESLSSDDRATFQSHLKSKGLAWDWGWTAGWKKAAIAGLGSIGATAAGLMSGAKDVATGAADKVASTVSGVAASIPGVTLRSHDGPEFDWSAHKDIDPKLAAELKSLGIKSPDQLESLSTADRTKFEAHLKSKGLSWDWGWQWLLGKSSAESKAATAKLQKFIGSGIGAGAAASADLFNWPVERKPASSKEGIGFKPTTFDGPSFDWSGQSDIDPQLAAEFKALGIKSPDHINSLSAKERKTFTAHLGAKGLKWDWNWPWLKASTESLADKQTSGGSTENITEKKRRIGFAASPQIENIDTLKLFHGKPKFKDDLTLLDGIDGPQAIALQKMGVFNFDQLHKLPPHDRSRLQLAFRKQGWMLDMEQWRIASEGNTLHPSIEDIQRKAYDIYEERERKGFGGGERTDWEQAEWELRGNPIFSYGVPHEIDDFALSVTGVTPDARDELYRMGLYNSHQLANLSVDARRQLSRWFAGPRFGVDVTQSFGWLDQLVSIPTDRDFGRVFSVRPADVDDLSDIEGIGGPTEHNLNRLGIYRFSQIADWTPENIRAIADVLNLDDRIGTGKWVEQARALRGN